MHGLQWAIAVNKSVKVRNWLITVNYSSYNGLWLVNFLLLQPHPTATARRPHIIVKSNIF